MRLLLDAHFDPAVARTLGERSHDVVSAVELGPEVYQAADEEILAFATAEGRVLVTRNIRDFVRLHAALLGQERSHAGIVLVHSRTVPEGDRGAEIRGLEGLLQQPAAGDHTDTLVWLPPSHDPRTG